MAENVGHLVVVSIATSLGGTYTEISGVTSASVSRDREVLDITHFKDTSAHKLKKMGLKDTKLSLSGNLDIADSAQSQIRTRYDDGAAAFITIKWDGAAGTYRGASGLVTKFSLSADVLGSVEWSASVQFSGTSWT